MPTPPILGDLETKAYAKLSICVYLCASVVKLCLTLQLRGAYYSDCASKIKHKVFCAISPILYPDSIG